VTVGVVGVGVLDVPPGGGGGLGGCPAPPPLPPPVPPEGGPPEDGPPEPAPPAEVVPPALTELPRNGAPLADAVGVAGVVWATGAAVRPEW
jgi:hypothetical protein